MSRKHFLPWFVLLTCCSVGSTDDLIPASGYAKTNHPSDREFGGQNTGEARELVSGMIFHWCPPTTGAFPMGALGGSSNETQSVTISHGFWLGETEVTQGQWQTLMGSIPWRNKDHVKKGSDFPASCIRHGCEPDGRILPDTASDFCDRLTAQERRFGRLPAGWKYALPTEAQWEYACRAGTQSTFNFGDDVGQLHSHAWFKQNCTFSNELFAHRVGTKMPNAWGLHDMHGNVWEWCADWYQQKLPGGRDPVVLSGGSYRVRRGGSWNDYASGCGSATRVKFSQSTGFSTIGFRVAGVLVSDQQSLSAVATQ